MRYAGGWRWSRVMRGFSIPVDLAAARAGPACLAARFVEVFCRACTTFLGVCFLLACMVPWHHCAESPR